VTTPNGASNTCADAAEDEPMSDVADRRRALQDATDAVTALARRLLLDSEAHLGDQELSAELDRLRLAAEAGYAPLAIVGPEGAGKSSLVNALVQAAVSPVEEQEAGTAVAVTVSWGPAPAYAVIDRAGRRAVDAETFRRSVLQQHNEDNTLRLSGAHVQLPATLLADGLILLDLPGTAGYAHRVREQTANALAGVRRAVLVVRNRSYGPALRLLEQWRDRLRVEAVVSNWDLDFWLLDPGTLNARIAAQRDLIRRHLELDLPDERIFVLHLPSIDGAAVRSGSRADSAELRRQLDLCTAWITATAGESGQVEALRQWTDALTAPVNRIDHVVRRAEALLAARPSERVTRLAEIERTCRPALRSRLDELLSAARFGPESAAQRVQLRGLLSRQRRDLLAAAADALRARARIGWLDLAGSGQEAASRLRELLDDARSERVARARAAAETIVRHCAGPFTDAANALLAAYLPVDPEAVLAVHLPQSAAIPAVPEANLVDLLDVRRQLDRLAQHAQEMATVDPNGFVEGQLGMVRGALGDAADRYLTTRIDQLRRSPSPLTLARYAEARRTLNSCAAVSGKARPSRTR
jgi:hypothetical protein